jgi:trehalose/maltose hydrolase-like predicted phosphorylase
MANLTMNLAFLRSLLLCTIVLNLLFPTIATPVEEDAARFVQNSERRSVEPRATTSSSLYNTRFPGTTWDNAKWQLNTTNLDQGHYQSRAFIANGYIGLNVAALGPFFEVETPVDGDNINGWPIFERRQSFATVGGFWDSQPVLNNTNFPWLSQYGWDTAISGLPHWGGIHLDLGGGTYLGPSTKKSTISGFSSVLDMKRATMNWAYTWSPTATNSFEISYTAYAHRLHPNQAVIVLNITAQKTQNVTVVNVLNGDCAVRTKFIGKGEADGLIFSAVSPNGVPDVTAYVYAGMNVSGASFSPLPRFNLDQPYIGNNQSSIAQAIELELKAGESATVYKYVGIASSDGFSQPAVIAENAVNAAMKAGPQVSLNSHSQEWQSIFNDAMVDDYSFPENGSLPNDEYLIESAIVAVANPYHILQNTLSPNATKSVDGSINSHSISVGGLASDSYAGQVFWDADVWMQPGLVASFPSEAQGISNYRTSRYPQAMKNVKTAYQSSMKKTHFSSNAAVYSWTSGRFGNCTATGPCFDYEYHINGDIAQQLVNYWIASGDTSTFKSQMFPVYDSLATFLSETLHQKGTQYELLNMTDPDEYANYVDNGAYTMALIGDTLKNANSFRQYFSLPQNTTWALQAPNVIIGRNEAVGITLEFIGMNGSVSVKQADVVLNTYPLRYTGTKDSYDLTDSLSDLNWYAAKQSPDGPGMTYAIFSIVANEVSTSGCSSYTYQQYSERPYMRGPWYQFSEQLIDDFTTNGGTHPAYPFMTGHGGANQVVLYGYLGFRLVPDWQLHIDPALPPQIPQIQYRTFFWQGWPISAFSNSTHTTVQRPSSPVLSFRNSTFADSPIPVLVGNGADQKAYSLTTSSVLVIPNRMSAFNLTVPGNVAQCQPVASDADYVPGQFPISAVDGAASTKWQPTLAVQNASITVSVAAGQKIDYFYFDWAQAPPRNITISLTNSTLHSGEAVESTIVALSNIKPNIPYVAKNASQIVSYTSNTTMWTPSLALYTSSKMTLTIWGTQADGSGKLATNATGATVAEWGIIVNSAQGKREALEMELVNEKRSGRFLSKLSRAERRPGV